MSEERKERCSNCRFSSPNGDSEFCCHRYPPSIFGASDFSYFPIVSGNDWCGEWKEDPKQVTYIGNTP